MAKIFWGRHGATKANNPDNERVRGHSQQELDSKGREEAVKMAQFLKDKGIAKIYASDLPRAKETARIIQRELGGDIPVELLPDLRTWDPGVLTGRKVSEVQGAINYYEDHPNIAPPDGETIGNAVKRVNRAKNKLINRTRHTKQNIAAIAHTRPILIVKAEIDGDSTHKFKGLWKKAPGPGSVIEMNVGEGKPKMRMVMGQEESDKRS